MPYRTFCRRLLKCIHSGEMTATHQHKNACSVQKYWVISNFEKRMCSKMLVNHILSFVVLQFSNVVFAGFSSYDLGKCCESGLADRVWDCDEKSLGKRVCVREATMVGRSERAGESVRDYYCGSGEYAGCAGKAAGDACYDTIKAVSEGTRRNRRWTHTLYSGGTCRLYTSKKAVVCDSYQTRTLTFIGKRLFAFVTFFPLVDLIGTYTIL